MPDVDDFPPAHELRGAPDEEIRRYIAVGAHREDEAVREEAHRRWPQLALIHRLADRSYAEDSDGQNVMLVPEPSDRTRALTAAYDALAHAIATDDHTHLKHRPHITLGEIAELAECKPTTYEGYAARHQALRRIGFDFATGAPIWDRDAVLAWVRYRPGRGARTDLQA